LVCEHDNFLLFTPFLRLLVLHATLQQVQVFFTQQLSIFFVVSFPPTE
jgi:hypothetical protein